MMTSSVDEFFQDLLYKPLNKAVHRQKETMFELLAQGDMQSSFFLLFADAAMVVVVRRQQSRSTLKLQDVDQSTISALIFVAPLPLIQVLIHRQDQNSSELNLDIFEYRLMLYSWSREMARQLRKKSFRAF
jgi:hypothetical protein